MLNFAISDLTSFLITYYCLGKVIAPNGELNTMTLRLQKQLCQANGMSASGRKADLLVTRRISRTMTMLLALLEKYWDLMMCWLDEKEADLSNNVSSILSFWKIQHLYKWLKSRQLLDTMCHPEFSRERERTNDAAASLLFACRGTIPR